MGGAGRLANLALSDGDCRMKAGDGPRDALVDEERDDSRKLAGDDSCDDDSLEVVPLVAGRRSRRDVCARCAWTVYSRLFPAKNRTASMSFRLPCWLCLI